MKIKQNFIIVGVGLLLLLLVYAFSSDRQFFTSVIEDSPQKEKIEGSEVEKERIKEEKVKEERIRKEKKVVKEKTSKERAKKEKEKIGKKKTGRVSAKELDGVWKVEKDFLFNKDTGKFEFLPPADPDNEYYVQYFLFDGENFCMSGSIAQIGTKGYSCEGMGWVKYELDGNVLILRKDLAYPGTPSDKWEFKLDGKNLEFSMSGVDFKMKKMVRKIKSEKDFMKADEIKKLPGLRPVSPF